MRFVLFFSIFSLYFSDILWFFLLFPFDNESRKEHATYGCCGSQKWICVFLINLWWCDIFVFVFKTKYDKHSPVVKKTHARNIFRIYMHRKTSAHALTHNTRYNWNQCNRFFFFLLLLFCSAFMFSLAICWFYHKFYILVWSNQLSLFTPMPQAREFKIQWLLLFYNHYELFYRNIYSILWIQIATDNRFN